MRRAIGMVLVMGILCAGVWGELTTEQAKEVQGLIGQFSSEEFKVREEAVQKLVEMGRTCCLW